jgi:hypothetical protein
LDLGLHIVDGVGRLHLEGDSLAREGLDENLHGDLDDGQNALMSTNATRCSRAAYLNKPRGVCLFDRCAEMWCRKKVLGGWRQPKCSATAPHHEPHLMPKATRLKRALK